MIERTHIGNMYIIEVIQDNDYLVAAAKSRHATGDDYFADLDSNRLGVLAPVLNNGKLESEVVDALAEKMALMDTENPVAPIVTGRAGLRPRETIIVDRGFPWGTRVVGVA
ncbi:MAG: hypothetical protein AABW46_01510 [Nanoarchaeota archaeon]